MDSMMQYACGDNAAGQPVHVRHEGPCIRSQSSCCINIATLIALQQIGIMTHAYSAIVLLCCTTFNLWQSTVCCYSSVHDEFSQSSWPPCMAPIPEPDTATRILENFQPTSHRLFCMMLELGMTGAQAGMAFDGGLIYPSADALICCTLLHVNWHANLMQFDQQTKHCSQSTPPCQHAR